MTASVETSTSSPHSRLFSYTGWGLAALFFSYAWILRVSPSVMVEPMMRDFAVSGAIIGNLSAVYFYAYAALQIPVGMAHDRWGPRRVLSIMALVAGGGTFIFAIAPTVEIAYVGRALIGTGCAFAVVGAMVLASRWLPPQNFTFFVGLAFSIGLIGATLGQGPLAHVVSLRGWRETMIILASCALLLSAMIWLFTRDHPHTSSIPEPSQSKNSGSAVAALWGVAKNPQTIYASLFACLMGAPTLAFGGLWGVPYTMQAFDISRTDAAFTISFIFLGWLIGGPFWGWISDRLQRRKIPILIGATITTLTIIAALYTPDINLDIYRLLLFINGFAGGTMTIGYPLVKEHNASNGSGAGAAMGLINMLAVAGGAIFQPFVGLLLDNQWDGTLVDGARIYSPDAYAQAFLILPILYIGSLVFGLLIRETYGKPVQ